MERKYEFVWKDTVGADLSLSRPTLGPPMRVESAGARTCRFEARVS
ncbi:MAG: hypothetical protein LBI91_02840 [Spirochaetaceae bacterium]|jgi:hypothetical protein|nr:hypothetical protein [Spirochaetaceae bacterium]